MESSYSHIIYKSNRLALKGTRPVLIDDNYQYHFIKMEYKEAMYAIHFLENLYTQDFKHYLGLIDFEYYEEFQELIIRTFPLSSFRITDLSNSKISDLNLSSTESIHEFIFKLDGFMQNYNLDLKNLEHFRDFK